jgi:hypothetical protein
VICEASVTRAEFAYPPERTVCGRACVAVLGHEAHSLARQARGYPPGAERRADILAYIIDYKTVHDGLSPTIRDIASECSIPSTSTVSYYLATLETEGKIKLAERGRGIMVVGGLWALQAGAHAAQGQNGR